MRDRLRSRKAGRQSFPALLDRPAMRMDNLIAWAGSILDLLTFQAPEETEAAIAGTAMEMVLPAIAIRNPIGDNDP